MKLDNIDNIDEETKTQVFEESNNFHRAYKRFLKDYKKFLTTLAKKLDLNTQDNDQENTVGEDRKKDRKDKQREDSED